MDLQLGMLFVLTARGFVFIVVISEGFVELSYLKSCQMQNKIAFFMFLYN